MIQIGPSRFFFLFILAVLLSARVIAQPLLPDIIGVSQNGMNILSWTSQYDGIKSIAVQRSSDSVYNFSTIGYVKSLVKGQQAFIDGRPNPGSNWYRLYIAFNSDLTWSSNRIKIMVDSADLLKNNVVMSNDSLQKLASRVRVTDTSAKAGTRTPTSTITSSTTAAGTNSTSKPVSSSASTTTTAAPSKPVITLSIPDASGVDAYTYIKSEYIFTNPFTGHINVEIKDSKSHAYSIVFYDQKNKPVLVIPRVPEPAVIIDKRNFQRKGMYKFELMKNKEKLEMGYITIY
jgi:hypothetical protein